MFSGRALDLKAHPAVKCDGSRVHGEVIQRTTVHPRRPTVSKKDRVEPASETASPIIEINRDKVDAGALGYVLERRMATDLRLAIEAALEGKRFLFASLAEPDR